MLAVSMASRPRADRKHRQTYPGPNPADNQQMVQDIKESIASSGSLSEKKNTGESKASNGPSSSVDSDKEMKGEKVLERERPPSRDLEQSKDRRSPLSDREQTSPGATPRVAQNRATPTKQLDPKRRQQLRDIRKTLHPWCKSDPGLAGGKEKVNKVMLEQLINLGHSEVSLSSSLRKVPWGAELAFVTVFVTLPHSCHMACVNW